MGDSQTPSRPSLIKTFWLYGVLGNLVCLAISMVLSRQIHLLLMEPFGTDPAGGYTPYPAVSELLAKGCAALLPFVYSLYVLRSIWRKTKAEEQDRLNYLYSCVCLFFLFVSVAILGFLVKEIFSPSLPYYLTKACTDRPCL